MLKKLKESELILSVLKKEPLEFKKIFESLILERIRGLVSERKEEISKKLFRD